MYSTLNIQKERLPKFTSVKDLKRGNLFTYCIKSV